MSDVRQCPYCELRFPSRTELEGHIATDHPGALDDVDDDTAPGGRQSGRDRARPGAP